MPVQARVIRIGNSRGIRIPKVLLEECHLGEMVELDVEDGHLVVHAAKRPRQGWEESFRRMAEAGDDKLLDAPVATHWDKASWRW